MRPMPDRMLQLLAQNLAVELVPSLDTDYQQRSAMLSVMLLATAAEEWDRAAARRVEENRTLRELFREVAPQLADAELRGRLEAAAGSQDESLRISSLEQSNDGLRALLIDLHAHVEGLDSPEARRIEARIWDELRRSTERRALTFHPF